MGRRVFCCLFSYLSGSREPNSQERCRRRFCAAFGVTPKVCTMVWYALGTRIPGRASPKHLLWALLFLNCYSTENMNYALTGADEKTFRKWSWIFVELIAGLPVIKWNNRPGSTQRNVNVTVDGTDCRIVDSALFNRKWFSHKFSGPSVRYEVAVSIEECNIVWVRGPFPCGSFPDLKIFRLLLKRELSQGENFVAGGGYPDNSVVRESIFNLSMHIDAPRIRARHETVNSRLKHFLVLVRRFRHDLSRHGYGFHAVANLTQLMIENGYPMFQV